MTATGHAIVGAAIASKIPDPKIALPLIFLSHFLGDKLPHWDAMTSHHSKSKSQIIFQSAADVILSYVLVFLIFIIYKNQNPVYIFLAAFIAQSPDWLELPHLFFPAYNFAPARLSYRVQSWFHDVWFDSRLAAPWGIATQVVVCILFLYWSLI